MFLKIMDVLAGFDLEGQHDWGTKMYLNHTVMHERERDGLSPISGIWELVR